MPKGHQRHRRLQEHHKKLGRRQGQGVNSLSESEAELWGELRSQSATSASALAPYVASQSSYDSGGYAVSSYDGDCCSGVVDPFTLLSTLSLIAGGTLALRQLSINTFGKFGKKRKRKRRRAVASSIGRRITGRNFLGTQGKLNSRWRERALPHA
jgi:hypothetical protein